MSGVGNPGDRHPLGLAGGQNVQVAGLGLDLEFGRRERVPAIRTGAHRGVHDAVALGAVLGGCNAILTALGALGLDSINRAVAGDVAGKVQDQAIGLTRRQPTAAPHDLDIQPRRLCGAQHGEKVHAWGVEPGGEHIGVGQALNPAGLEVIDDGLALRPGRVPDDGLTAHTTRTNRIAHMVGMVHTGTEDEPVLAVLAVGEDFVNGGLGD